MSNVSSRVSAVVVDFHAEVALVKCVESLRANGVEDIVVVENGDVGSSRQALANSKVTVVEPGINLGYGRGVNRGAATSPAREFLLISNPDVIVHDGAVGALIDYLDTHLEVGIVGPQIVRPDGTVYPSQRVFPNVWLAGLHALLEPLWPTNPATRRYRSSQPDEEVDWISGAFLLIRRRVFEAVGGFDERYFMFAEDMALCWHVHELGHAVASTTSAVVTHIEGLSRSRASREMEIAHHRSALMFEWQTARGFRRLMAPVATLVLGVRLLLVLAQLRRSRDERWSRLGPDS
ncbi:MAG: glycosyltransferase family 2 protein [Acidimicrobiaceae bacterium]|nr:glycosyltransferase family 2 protein [Acidimicrobiaceae bacterium]